jgi:hypothetical protein
MMLAALAALLIAASPPVCTHAVPMTSPCAAMNDSWSIAPETTIEVAMSQYPITMRIHEFFSPVSSFTYSSSVAG